MVNIYLCIPDGKEISEILWLSPSKLYSCMQKREMIHLHIKCCQIKYTCSIKGTDLMQNEGFNNCYRINIPAS